ncbi:MAG: hypothetical protein GY861_14900 [bacterium]|nr:hypothetical protein [bacterium]
MKKIIFALFAVMLLTVSFVSAGGGFRESWAANAIDKAEQKIAEAESELADREANNLDTTENWVYLNKAISKLEKAQNYFDEGKYRKARWAAWSARFYAKKAIRIESPPNACVGTDEYCEADTECCAGLICIGSKCVQECEEIIGPGHECLPVTAHCCQDGFFCDIALNSSIGYCVD